MPERNCIEKDGKRLPSPGEKCNLLRLKCTVKKHKLEAIFFVENWTISDLKNAIGNRQYRQKLFFILTFLCFLRFGCIDCIAFYPQQLHFTQFVYKAWNFNFSIAKLQISSNLSALIIPYIGNFQQLKVIGIN